MPNIEGFGEPITGEESSITRKESGDFAFKKAEDIYNEELRSLEKNATLFNGIEVASHLAMLVAPLYFLGKHFDIDLEQMTGVNIAESPRILATFISALGGTAGLVINGELEKYQKKIEEIKDQWRSVVFERAKK